MTSRKSRSITLSVSESEKVQLEALALEFGQTWGDKPNVSKLVKAIARGKLRLAINHDWSHERVDTLYQVLNWLKDEGHMNNALVLGQLLLERSELNDPIRQDIQKFVDAPGPPWRLELEAYMRQHRPFQLTYQDAAEQLWHFTIRHAKIVFHEDRQYLDCWCDETQGNQDIEELQHNWSLRLDGIPESAALSPILGHWQPELGWIEVEIHLLNRLAFAYTSKSHRDVLNYWDGERRVRRVIRRINSTFWFFREIRRYGCDCVVIAPDSVRTIFVQELHKTLNHYSSQV